MLSMRRSSGLVVLRNAMCSLAELGCHDGGERRRMVHFYELFNKEKREQGRKRLQEEMKKGHFDDFKQLRDTRGKLFRGSPNLLPISSRSLRFPNVCVTDGQDEYSGITAVFDSPKDALLVCVACREGAQPMIDAWTGPVDVWFSKQKDVSFGIVELSVVDSLVMSMWPFRSFLKQTGFEEKYSGADARSVFLFGRRDGFQDVLDMFENRLIGYVYLLDSTGRIRWRGCGFPEDAELEHLLQATTTLLNEYT